MSRVEPLARIAVGVVVGRRKAKSAWVDFVWQPVAILAGVPDAEPWTVLGGDAGYTTFYAGSAEIALFRTESGNYAANLATGAPKLWAVLCESGTDPPYKIVTVTADPGEGEAFTESGSDLVEALPMPEPVRVAIAAFVAEHHVEHEAFSKRRRDRADPEALARRAPIKDRK